MALREWLQYKSLFTSATQLQYPWSRNVTTACAELVLFLWNEQSCDYMKCVSHWRASVQLLHNRLWKSSMHACMSIVSFFEIRASSHFYLSFTSYPSLFFFSSPLELHSSVRTYSWIDVDPSLDSLLLRVGWVSVESIYSIEVCCVECLPPLLRWVVRAFLSLIVFFKYSLVRRIARLRRHECR